MASLVVDSPGVDKKTASKATRVVASAFGALEELQSVYHSSPNRMVTSKERTTR